MASPGTVLSLTYRKRNREQKVAKSHRIFLTKPVLKDGFDGNFGQGAYDKRHTGIQEALKGALRQVEERSRP